MDDDLASLRVDYGAHELTQTAAGSDPMLLFRAWLEDARARPSVPEPNAMSLASATADGVPSVRMVLLKNIDPARAAFTWYTNLASRKAREILERDEPVAALALWWPGDASLPGRQVRAVGRVEVVERDIVQTYFDSRPRAARIGAIASRQSRPVVDRATLDARATAVAGTDVTVPDDWGGLRLVADELEFWQGRSGRLHDRIVFLRERDGVSVPQFASRVVDAAGTAWHRTRLEP